MDYATSHKEKLSLKIHAALRIHADFYLKNPASRALTYSFPYPVLTEKPDGKSFHAEIGVSTGSGRKIYGMIPETFLSGITGTAAFQTQAPGIFLIAVFRFSGKTQNAGMPFVFMAFPDPPRQALRSASGASL